MFFDGDVKLESLGGATASRMRNRRPIAQTDVSINLPDGDALARCLSAIEESDKRLAAGGGHGGVPYDWQIVLSESRPDGSGRVHFGVYWYDEAFFQEKKGVFKDSGHSRIFQSIGITPENLEVRHYRLVDA